MIEALLAALAEMTSAQHLLYLFAGVAMGLVVGVFPGLGGIVGLSLLLPFLYGMDPTSALSMLIGLVAIIPTSDTFTSVLMGIPGSSASQATVLDGFPLAKKGEGARALGAAFSASLFGGIVGAMVLTVVIVVARPIILLFGSAELFMLTILGLSMVGVLAGASLVKGVLACGLGLLFGAVGGAPATGEYRMAFGSFYLGDGLPLVVIGLSMFAVPEIVDLLRAGGAIARTQTLGHGWLQGLKDMWLYKWLCLRCAGIGCIIGALPGLGGSVVDWIAYGHVKQTVKDLRDGVSHAPGSHHHCADHGVFRVAGCAECAHRGRRDRRGRGPRQDHEHASASAVRCFHRGVVCDRPHRWDATLVPWGGVYGGDQCRHAAAVGLSPLHHGHQPDRQPGQL